MSKIRIDFCDFWPGFNKTDNFFYHFLRQHFDIELCDKPDFLIYSHEGHVHRLHTAVRIFFTMEDYAPDFRVCDYAFTCRHLDTPRHLRLPIYVLLNSAEDLVKKEGEAAMLIPSKTKFCSFVVSNGNPQKTRHRIDFFKKLSQYKKVDSAGRVLNNMDGYTIPCVAGAKTDFLRPYKFNIAFENKSLAGYTTEKIADAMSARCIPIYFGDPLIHEEFNPKSFLNYHDFPDEDALIERIREIDTSEEEYRKILDEPFFHNNKPNVPFGMDRLKKQFERIFTEKIDPVARRRPFISPGRWILAKKNKPA